MLESISGVVQKLTPTYAVVTTSGLGFYINISVNTCEKLRENTSCVLLLHEVIREDAFDLYGFFDENERSMFRLLISVSGIGANTARVILSKMTPSELASAILSGDSATIQSIKGIGAKTAQRVVLELKDKVSFVEGDEKIVVGQGNTLKIESLSALVMLGYQKSAAEKVVDAIMRESVQHSVEDIVKIALKRL
ncbi:MAG: Holliday junction branch migration protein RuvA [Bacteroidales bacterium]|nr:Holliday junction branch migration protein RuvA [Bacteroidales bacterium]MBQ4215368.1 Holliday junction branch migration protein RuvA [Bacteroidales bacterium]MBR4497919.1 Holliday junction branch migration protein RuvA [Bacteroidales bacterium]